MQLTFGKYRGMSVESLVLKEPAYALWLLDQARGTGDLAAAREEVTRLIGIFDAKPVITACSACGNRATRCTLYGGGVRPRWWCDGCDPEEGCPHSGKLHTVRTYGEAAHYHACYCGGRGADLRALIRELARARGLPARVDAGAARHFFHVPRPAKRDPEFDAYWDALESP